MRISINSFRGEAPRVTPRALPDNAAQQATNARLLTGDLEAWRQFALTLALDNTGPVQTIYKLADEVWLSWNSDVDVARGAVAGDTSMRVFLTSPDEYEEARWTNLEMAQDGSTPYPSTTRPLGVPGPDAAPTVVPGVDPNPTTFNVDVFDEGDTLSQWTVGDTPGASGYTRLVSETPSFGNPAGSYRIDAANNASQAAFMYRNFGSENCNVFRMAFDFNLQSGTGYGMMGVNVQNTSAGNGIQVLWLSDAGLIIQISDSWIYPGGGALVVDPTVGLAADTWYTCEVTVLVNSDGTQTVTAAVYLGSARIGGSVSATGTFNIGGYSGLVGCVNLYSITHYDNIVVQGSGATGYTPISTATSYVFTYVNDIGEESAPSLASSTVLRPDGVSITVTTPTADPDADYVIETKRIYRAVTGATGTFFRFVAEIPLATADYVDTLPDTELGEALESEGWDLPPAELKGLLALPNGVMAGFFSNQLCFSAQNRPHAWPTSYRLTVDTDIVAIGNIDTTVVVGTEAFPYLAIGTSPDAYSMTKLEVQQACVAKRSLAYLVGIGVVFASPDGLIAVAGNGNVRNLTGGVFTRDQWQALRPESIVASSHDDVYHFFYDNEEPAPADYFLDTFTGAAGLLEGHTPDVAPTGFAYEPPAVASGLELSGTGELIHVDGSMSARSNDTWSPMSLGTFWRMELHGTVTDGSSEGGDYLLFNAAMEGTANDMTIEMDAVQGGQAFVSAAAGASTTIAAAFVADGEVQAHAVVSANSVVLYVNGEVVAAAAGDHSELIQFARTYYEIESSNAGASMSRVAIYPDVEAIAVNVAQLNLNSLEYFSEYLADFETLEEIGGSIDVALGTGVTSLDSATTPQLMFPATAARTSRSGATDLTGVVRAFEFKILSLASGCRAAGGFFPTGGPPINLDGYVGGNTSWLSAWGTDGQAYGYGSAPTPPGPVAVGDVIGVVVEEASAHFYLNGEFQFTSNLANNTGYPCVSFTNA